MTDGSSASPLDEQLAALWALGKFVARGDHQADTPAEQIVTATTGRMLDTVRAIVGLLSNDAPAQAAMLLRPLFEDMVVSHWLIDQEDPGFLVTRFLDHQDAIALHQHRLASSTGWAVGTPLQQDVSALLPREAILISDFGREAQRDWWGVDARGDRVNLGEVVGRLEASARYVPRFAGGAEPLLARWYQTVQKLANQYLHHTPVGLGLRLTRGERMPSAYVDETLPFFVAFCAYWTMSQQVYLQLLVEDVDAVEFNALFAGGFNTFTRFLRSVGRDVPDLSPSN